VVALVAVEDQQPVLALYPGPRMVVEVLIQSKPTVLVVQPLSTPVGREVALGVPVSWRGGTARPR
jgi:hypothetical protein